MTRLSPAERFWVYNYHYIMPVLVLASVALCLILDKPGNNPGDNELLGGLAGSAIGLFGLLWFFSSAYRDCTTGPTSFEGRRKRALETRGSRYGRHKVVAQPDGEYVKITTYKPTRCTWVPNLWPLAMPWEAPTNPDARSFHAERDAEAAMEYFNEREAELDAQRELTNGELEARALAEVLNR